jgi:hypothetical protein
MDSAAEGVEGGHLGVVRRMGPLSKPRLGGVVDVDVAEGVMGRHLRHPFKVFALLILRDGSAGLCSIMYVYIDAKNGIAGGLGMCITR